MVSWWPHWGGPSTWNPRKQNSTAKRCVVLIAARSAESSRYRHEQQSLGDSGAKSIRAPREVTSRENGCRNVLRVLEARFARDGQHLRRREEADERRPTRALPSPRPRSRRSSGSASSSGIRNVIANVEPDASVATCRNVSAIASRVKYILTPVEATTAGRLVSKPAAANRPCGAARTYRGPLREGRTGRHRRQPAPPRDPR
jgi:hypothetical protein